MKLNQNPNLRVEDFPSEQSWIGKLFTQLNPFITAVNQVFDSNIDFVSNIKAVTKDYSITSFQSFGLQWPYKESPPNELKITKATKGSQFTPTILLPVWSYDATNAVITVSNLFEISGEGVSALSGRYSFTLRANV